MKKMILGLFYMLAMFSSNDAKAGVDAPKPTFDKGKTHNGIEVAGCAFDNLQNHQNMINNMRNLLHEYIS